MQPMLRTLPVSRQRVENFGGLNRRLRPAVGEFARAENLCADHYPLLCTRPGRGETALAGQAGGMLAGDGLCWVEDTALVLPSGRRELGLAPGEKRLVAMGSYILIFPDKKYANTLDMEDFGSMEAEYIAGQEVRITPCTLEGGDRAPDFIQPEAPEEPENGALWVDTSGESPALKQWSQAGSLWVSLDGGYLRLEAPGIGRDFRQYDGVSLSGVEALAGENTVWLAGENVLVISGLLAELPGTLTGLTIRRWVPEMDYVTQCGNRLWGCRAGKNRLGQTVNEIYCCKLGDFRNWNSYLGLSTDSFTLSVGAPGSFTGAVTYLGMPLFFKEDCMFKLYGAYPAAFRVQCSPCRGVQAGCAGSLAVGDGVLYYRSPFGVCAYDGAQVTDISPALGRGVVTHAAGAVLGDTYYLAMDLGGQEAVYSYHTRRGIWHMQPGTAIRELAAVGTRLYAREEGGQLVCLRGEQSREKISWLAQTGTLFPQTPEGFLRGVELELALEPHGMVRVLARYDGQGAWQSLGAAGSAGQRFRLTLRPRRCRRMELRLEGQGGARLYAMTLLWQKGEGEL